MGSTKKHKKDRDSSRKYKHRSRSPLSRSRSRSPSPERDRKRSRHQRDRHRRHRTRSPEHRPMRDEYHSDSSDVVEVPMAPPAPKITHSPPRSSSPIPENGAGDCLSIEETNKLRLKLGLKPLEVSSTTSKDPQKTNESGESMIKDEWGEFFHKPAANIGDKKEADKIREKLQERKQKRALEEKLKRIKALGENDEDDDASSWVEKLRDKKKLKAEAEKRAKMLEEMDEEFTSSASTRDTKKRGRQPAYRDRDLAGLRVEHDVEQFEEGKSVILTLKDKDVLDDDDDALVNVNMMDDERYNKNIENKKQLPNRYGYDVYEEEYDEFGEPLPGRSILGKYDEEIHGTKKKIFRIGENIAEEKEQKRRILELKTKLAGRRLESLTTTALQLASDTYTEEELVKFKKPKKKIKKIKQKLKADDLLAIAGDATTSSDFGRRRRNIDTDDTETPTEKTEVKVEEEDNELEQILSKARRLKQKEAIIKKPLPIDMEQIKAEIKEEPEEIEDETSTISKDGNIVLNATAEFCRTLGDIPTYGMAGNRDEDISDMMDFEQEVDELIVPEPEEEERGTWNTVDPEAEKMQVEDTSNDVNEIAILDEEPDVGSGIAAALKLAMSKGYLEKEENNRPSNTRMAHLQAKNYSIEDKTYVEDDKFGRRDRFHAGPISDFRDKDGYKPNVKLEYIDDNGRILNEKEAFRYLSHKFHGKGPGKNKIEKRLKKAEQEGLMMKMSSTDTPLGTLNMLQHKQKETHSAYVVLSGNKQIHGTSSIGKHK